MYTGAFLHFKCVYYLSLHVQICWCFFKTLRLDANLLRIHNLRASQTVYHLHYWLPPDIYQAILDNLLLMAILGKIWLHICCWIFSAKGSNLWSWNTDSWGNINAEKCAMLRKSIHSLSEFNSFDWPIRFLS